jgi:arsenate reductase
LNWPAEYTKASPGREPLTLPLPPPILQTNKEDRVSDVTIYHNPRCSKSRETLKLLQERGIDPEIVDYLTTPPDAQTLTGLLRQLGIEAKDLLRRKEDEYQTLGLADKLDDEAALVQAMVEHPVLIERPIVVKGDAARLGRPPESVVEIL